jgi:hypothetical protein
MAAIDAQRLANSFRKLGWAGVWIQALLAIIPLAMFVYLMMGKIMGVRPTLGFADYLALCGLAILAFTTFWSYRYTRAAPKLADADRRPSWPATVRMLWVGLWASCIGIAISLLLLLIEVVRLLILFLKAPQAGVPAIRTELETRLQWVSAIDVVSLLAEVCTLIGELAILGLTLWLLFAVWRHRDLFENASAHEADPAASS